MSKFVTFRLISAISRNETGLLRDVLRSHHRDVLIEKFCLSFFKVYEKLAYVLNHWGELIPMNHT